VRRQRASCACSSCARDCAEDRWAYVHGLQKSGFGPDALAAAERIMPLSKIISAGGKSRWRQPAILLDEVRHEPWAETVNHSDSSPRRMLATNDAMWLSPLIYWWYVGDTRARHSYDPVRTMALAQTRRIPSATRVISSSSPLHPPHWRQHVRRLVPPISRRRIEILAVGLIQTVALDGADRARSRAMRLRYLSAHARS
jgi:hypothetical protein